ncbi:hypothetical protein C4J81_10920 [Deltaproteobacteria bacterium Smac51]|nr:hypothetical protein C4J81_10920 [Deltaproteobacteria bacterium Smac51]
MNTLSTRINGQADYRPANVARAAWRDEMLDDLLSQMRDHKLPDLPATPPIKEAAIPGKGSYVDLYV